MTLESPFKSEILPSPFRGESQVLPSPFKPLPENWVGRPLSQPVEMYKGGSDYLKLVDMNKSGRRGLLEEAFDPEVVDLPFVGSIPAIAQAVGITKTAKKLQNNEDVSDQELVDLNKYLEYQRRKSAMTIGGKVVSVIQSSLTLGAEVAATGLLAAVTAGPGASAGAVPAGKAAALKAAQKATQRFLMKTVGKRATRGIARTAGIYANQKLLTEGIEASTETALRGAIGKTAAKVAGKVAKVGASFEIHALANQMLHPERTVRAIAERQLVDTLKGGDGTVAQAIAKGFLDMHFEYGSEFMGEFITGALGDAARRVMIKGLGKEAAEKAFKQMGQSAILSALAGKSTHATPGAAAEMLRVMKFDGILGEIAEERVGDFLRGLFGVEGEAGLVNALRQSWPDGEQFTVEAIAFSAMPLMAFQIDRVTGSVSAEEFAETLAALKSVEPNADVTAMTEGEINAAAEKFVDLLRRESEAAWYLGGKLDALKHVFGEQRRGSLASQLTRMGVKNLTEVHDQAYKEYLESHQDLLPQIREANARAAGTRKVAQHLAWLQQVHTQGLRTQKDIEKWNAGVKGGKIVQSQDKHNFFATVEALSDAEYKKFVQRTGITAEIPIADAEKLRIGSLRDVVKDTTWDHLTHNKRRELSVRWNETDLKHVREKYEWYQRIMRRPELNDIEFYETMPAVLTGTYDEFKKATGYDVANPESADFDPEKTYRMHMGARTHEFGEEVDFSVHASLHQRGEDVLEARLKNVMQGAILPEAAGGWVQGIQDKLEADNAKTEFDRKVLRMLHTPKGRFEFFVKTFLGKELGYASEAGQYARQIARFDLDPAVREEMDLLVGADFLNALSLQEEQPAGRTERGERHRAVRDIIRERPAGGVAQARQIVQEAMADAPEMLGQLSAALGQDMRKAENRTGVQDILDEMDRKGITFALEQLSDIDAAAAIQEIQKNLAAKTQIGKATRDDVTAMQQFLEDTRVREDRAIEYPTPPLAEPVFSEEEIVATLPPWFSMAGLEEAKADYVDEFDDTSTELQQERNREMAARIKREQGDEVALPEEDNLVTIDRLAKDLDRVSTRLRQGAERYQATRRPGTKTVVMPRNRSRSGQRVMATGASPLGPFAAERRLAGAPEMDDVIAGRLTPEEEQFVSEEFSEDVPGVAQGLESIADVERDEMGEAKEPRKFWEMKPLSEASLENQLEVIVPIGNAVMLNYAEEKAGPFKKTKRIDAVHLPAKKKYGPHPREGYLRYLAKAPYEEGVKGQSPYEHDSRRLPHLAKIKAAVKAADTDVEGGIFVIDFTENSLEDRLAFPIGRAHHALLTGDWATGKIFPSWRFYYNQEGKKRMHMVLDVDAVVSQLDQDFGVRDFLMPADATGDSYYPGAYHGAAFPISAQKLKSIDINNDAQVEALAGRIHDWIARNKIRRLLIGGIDQIAITGTHESKDGTAVFDEFEVKSPSWGPAFRVVMNKALSKEMRNARINEPTAQPVQLDAVTIEGLEESIQSGGNMGFAQPGEGQARTSQDLYDEMIREKEAAREEQSARERFADPSLRRPGERFVFRPSEAGLQGQESTFALEEHRRAQKYIMSLVPERRELQHPVEYTKLRQFMDPDTMEQAWDEIGTLVETLFPTDMRDEVFRVLNGMHDNVEQALAEEQAEAGDEAQDTHSLELIDDLYKSQSPIMTSGDVGLRRILLEQNRAMRVLQNEGNAQAEIWREKVGLKRKIGMFGRNPLRDLPDAHREHAARMLETVGAMLDGSTRIPVGRGANGKIRQEPIAPRIAEWDNYIRQNKLDMPTVMDLRDEMRKRYDERRKKANEIMQEMSEEEWIHYVENYINHQYTTRTPEEREEAISWIKEESKRSKQRRIPSYEKAAEAKSLMPITMDATKLYEMWNRDVWSALRNKQLVTMASLVRDVDGSPVVIPVKQSEEQGDSLIPEEGLRKHAEYLAQYLGEKYDQSKDPVVEIRRLAGIIEGNPEYEYDRIDSPNTKSVSYFLVKKGGTGNVMKSILHYGKMTQPIVKGIERFNAWSKFMGMAFSGFHPFSLLESLSASFGITVENPAFHPFATRQALRDIVRDMRENPEDPRWKPWVAAGLMVNVGNPDVKLGLVEADLQRWIDQSEGKFPTVNKALKAFQKYKHWNDRWLWNELHPAIKVYTAETIFNSYAQKYHDFDEARVREEIAQHVNNAFGGQEWDQYVWATPKALQMLHLGMFSPDWTISAANIAGATRLPIINTKMHASNLSPLAKDEMLRRYWPAMAGIILFGIPNMIQAALYGVAGDPDEDDKPFCFMNEAGKQSHIDITPVLRRLPGYKGGDTGARRVYMRWGKQAYEVFEGWYRDAPHTLMSKSSPAFRTAFEQATGTTTSGWDLPFKGEGLLGTITSDGSFMKGRAGHVVQKFLPFSVLSVMQGRPTTFIAPASRGVTFGTVAYSMQKTIEAHLDRGVLPKELQSVDLSYLAADIVEAARRNGVDPEAAFTRARSKAMSGYYSEFFRAINDRRDGEAERIAEKLVQLGAGLDGFHRAMKIRLGDRYDEDFARRVESVLRVPQEGER